MITIYENVDALGSAVAELFLEKACLAVAERGRFTVSLAGGQTPQRIYEMLAKPPYSHQIPWEGIHIYWGDERYVPADDIRSNQLMARKAFLDHVPIPQEQIYPIVCNSTPEQAAKEYEEVIASTFAEAEPQFDFIFLGLGSDGHTASLFPNTSVLREKKHWTGHVYLPELDSHRVTLTAPLINQARTIAFLVTGDSKAQIVREVLEGPQDHLRLPSQMIAPENGELFWFLDQGASSLLSANKK
ncbi:MULTISPECIES: 6-phosphogluconolactonase [Pelosinus]|uniref:6-phosphogluconolactonase n=1 Tax=Pelosinus fermentans B4 TaxID=1149862 RepID=I9ATG0_9FIRM|nr:MULTISPECIES: 6-phosphogluconolactonase [Pelosinus]EIW16232.1 6-phosphogluconolactonase [Pelosinus fermentans B4]EIW22787.1 6-phosphogluconolactonase [Pelosinus fermentans A11]OAM95539.1 6-phosphogluconolactonase [Pelosinus fermentans DSM 17108]SDR29495.1 6-phosphogluconolactonase [Pelosinus fermentans]